MKKLAANNDFRKAIGQLESGMNEMEPLNILPVHHFAKGMYARELFMPAGAVVTSKIHKTEHFALILKGRVTVVQDDGERLIEAPYMTITQPGTKRALRVHEDTLWITFHPTEKTDVDEIEQDIIADDFDDADLLAMEELKCLG